MYVTAHHRLRVEVERSTHEVETAYEELQATNEALETTNEELQSTIEELETINEELRRRTSELNTVNHFMEAVMGSIRAGVVVTDRDMHVTLWNAKLENLWGLRRAVVEGKVLTNLDIGLPVDLLAARRRRPARTWLDRGDGRMDGEPDMRIAVLLIAAWCAALIAGCSDVLGGNDDSFSFNSMAIAYDTSLTDEATVVSVLRNIQIDGVIILPHPCFELRGDYRQTGGDVLFTASAFPTNPSCPAQPSAMQYRVNTFGTGRGTYRVRIYHNITGTAPRVVAETTVTVN